MKADRSQSSACRWISQLRPAAEGVGDPIRFAANHWIWRCTTTMETKLFDVSAGVLTSLPETARICDVGDV